MSLIERRTGVKDHTTCIKVILLWEGYDMLSFHVSRLTGLKWTTASIVWLRSVHFSSKFTAPGLRDIEEIV